MSRKFKGSKWNIIYGPKDYTKVHMEGNYISLEVGDVVFFCQIDYTEAEPTIVEKIVTKEHHIEAASATLDWDYSSRQF